MEKNIKKEHDFTFSQKQGIQRMMASSFEDSLGMGFLTLYSLTEWLRAKLTDKPLMDLWKGDYDKNVHRLGKLGIYCSDMNSYLLPYKNLENIKRLLREPVTSKKFIGFRLSFARATQHLRILYEAYVCLVENSTLRTMDIQNQYWATYTKIKEKLGEL